MAASHLLIYFILCVVFPGVHHIGLSYRFHVSEEGRSVTVLPPKHESYTDRKWRWGENIRRPVHIFYTQVSGGAVENKGGRPDMYVDPADFSLTIGSLQVSDTGWLSCLVTGHIGFNDLIVYNRFVEVKYRTSVTLQCPVATSEYITRQWYWKYESSHFLVYSQNSSGVTKGSSRADVSLDSDTFELTIGSVTLYDYRYSCIVTSAQTSVDITFLAIYRVQFEVEENTSVTLPCDHVKELTSRRTVSYSRTWQRVNGDSLYQQYWYLYINVFYERRPAARADMSLINETFALTIGRVKLEDDTMFLCSYFDNSHQYTESVKLIIFINPQIILHGLDGTPVIVGTTVTATCTIDRVYPELGPDDFQMRWATQTIMSTGSQNNDKSYSYTVLYTHTLNNGDNGTVVECLVNPKRGQSDSISRTIIVKNQNPSLSLPVIGGAVAAAAVLIIGIVISVCVCVKRKSRENKVTGQSDRSAEAAPGGDMNVTGCDEYLPGAAYHVYEEISAQGGGVPVDNLHLVDIGTGTYLHAPQDDGYENPRKGDAGLFPAHNSDTGLINHDGYEEPITSATAASAGDNDEGYLEVISDHKLMPLGAEKPYEKLNQYEKLQVHTKVDTNLQQ